MTDLVSQLVVSLKRLLATGGFIAEATDADLQQAIDDPHADEMVQDQAAAVLQARAALTAAKAGGWVAVPVEPTPEMIREVEHAARFGAVWTAASVYKAMLAARPTTPPKEQSAGGLGLVDPVAHPRSAAEERELVTLCWRHAQADGHGFLSGLDRLAPLASVVRWSFGVFHVAMIQHYKNS